MIANELGYHNLRHVITLLISTAFISGCSIGENVPVAENAVQHFHATLDSGKSLDIYRDAADSLKGISAEKDFTQLLDAVHKKLGTVKKSKQVGWNDNTTTTGHFITLNYETLYEGGSASENFVYELNNGQAKLAGYHINSMALIVK